MKEKSFRVYIFRLLKTVHSELHITKSAIETIDSTVRVVADRIVERALTLTSGDDKKTISSSEVETAVKMLFPASLSKQLLTLASSAMKKYEQSEESRPEKVDKAQTRESRCGLVFSVSASEKYVRRFGQVGYNVSATTPVCLAAVLESLARHLLHISGLVTQNASKITITVRHLFLAVSNEKELNDFLENLGVVFLNSGVEPQVVQTKQRSKSSRTSATSSESSEQETKRPHRWRPGTKTVMQIRKLQKGSDLLMQHAPFNRVVREVVEHLRVLGLEGKIRFTGEFFLSLQSLSESKLIDLMRHSNSLATHAGRETVYDHDVALVCGLTGVNTTPSYTYTSVIPEASLRQMALRAGIRRYGDSSTPAFRNFFLTWLESCLTDVVLCAVHHKVQTMNGKLLLEALNMRGIYPTMVAHKRRLGKRSGSRTTSQAVSQVDNEKEMEEPDLSDVEEEETE